jgi:hypothetical protein
MLEIYLLSLFITLLTAYGFQTRKAALEGFTADWRWRRTLARLVLWGAACGLWIGRAPRIWGWYAFLAGVGFLSGEIAVAFIRRGVKLALKSNRPLSLPQTHLIPLLTAAIPAIVIASFLARISAPTTITVRFLPLLLMKIATGLIALFCWSTTMTVSIIGLVRADQLSDKIEPHIGSGEVIGVLERLFTFVLILSGGLAAVGFAVAAKAAARYPQFKDPAFAEYFLIGTLSSVGLATVIGLLVGIGGPLTP